MKRVIGLVEDDDVIRQNYSEVLEDLGFAVRAFADRESAIDGFRERLPDVAVLDVALGHERDGGFQLCADLRRISEALPIIFLTSHDEEVNKISGLRLGADDFLSKENSLELLVVRIETLLRRYDSLARRGSSGAFGELVVGNLRIDRERAIAYWRDQVVEMPLTQLWIVEALAASPGRARSHRELMSAAKVVVEPNTIAAHIKTIRQRFKTIDPGFEAIRTERGLGYRWVST